MFFVVFELLAVEFGIVHLTEYVDHLLEEASALLEIVEFEAAAAYSEYQLDHIFLSLDRAEGIDCVECVLLEDDIVDEFGFPEYFVISHRYAVVTEDVDLLVGFTSVPFLFLSGISWPLNAIPAFWQGVGGLIPSTYAIRAYVRIATMGAGLSDVIPEYRALWIQAAAYFAAACIVMWRTRKG